MRMEEDHGSRMEQDGQDSTGSWEEAGRECPPQEQAATQAPALWPFEVKSVLRCFILPGCPGYIMYIYLSVYSQYPAGMSNAHKASISRSGTCYKDWHFLVPFRSVYQVAALPAQLSGLEMHQKKTTDKNLCLFASLRPGKKRQIISTTIK